MATYIGNPDPPNVRITQPVGTPTYVGTGSVDDAVAVGTLVLTKAVSTLVPGATSFAVRNHADTADNLIITDAGAVTFRAGGSTLLAGVHGATETFGVAEEELTLSTSTTITNSTTVLLPANSLIDSVVARVTTTITGSTDWKLGDPTSAARFSDASTSLAAASTVVGFNHLNPAKATTLALSAVNVSATSVSVNTTGNATAGKIRVTVFYRAFVAPTS